LINLVYFDVKGIFTSFS